MNSSTSAGVRLFDDLPQHVRALCSELLEGLKAVLKERLYALYLYGAMAFADSGIIQDIDFHVLLSDVPTDHQRDEIRRLHDGLSAKYPRLGKELDGYYILLADAKKREKPRHQIIPNVIDDSWALHRAHLRSGYGIVMYGPDPRKVLPEPAWEELDAALDGELDYVEEHLAIYPDYCVLNLCRILRSRVEKNVVHSKRGSAAWMMSRFVQWAPLIEAALRSYVKQLSPEDEKILEDQTKPYFHFVCERIAEFSV
jgi:hypothetical protein